MKNFIIIGGAGYIAPRHMEAIKNTGNNLIAVYDPYDGIGILDSYFPDASFFTEFERFDRFIELNIQQGTLIDFVSICSPNYLHDAHIRYGLRIGAQVICEKPVVLNSKNIDSLIKQEEKHKSKVHCILQLRHHESVLRLREKFKNTNKKIQCDLTYITSRGKWYEYSWKGNEEKSGGIAANIGVHFFDMLIWIFGSVVESKLVTKTKHTAIGTLVLERATVNWKLSIDRNELPKGLSPEIRTFRNLRLGEEHFEFSKGFTDLHTTSYEKILDGNSYGLKDAKPSIDLITKLS